MFDPRTHTYLQFRQNREISQSGRERELISIESMDHKVRFQNVVGLAKGGKGSPYEERREGKKGKTELREIQLRRSTLLELSSAIGVSQVAL